MTYANEMTKCLSQMSDVEVLNTFNALMHPDTDWGENYWGSGFTMEDWAEHVYSEKSRRNL
jgi:hypothetical protein